MTGRNNHGNNYKNPCLTMHQPWASLLVHGIKRIEGRSWPAPIRGRLWIHAASKVPNADTINAMEDFYREIYALDGITDLKFPEEYPVSRLLGCVEVVGCIRLKELASWQAVPEGVRLEAQTDFCWLCEDPLKLLVPFEMRGNQGIYNLERKISEGAFRGLSPAESPFPIEFPLPNAQDPFSLRPGSISHSTADVKASEGKKSSSLIEAIAGAQAAAVQFSRKDPNSHANIIQKKNSDSILSGKLKNMHLEEERNLAGGFGTASSRGNLSLSSREGSIDFEFEGSNESHRQVPRADSDSHPVGSAKIFAAAVKGLHPV
ncbi:hypothetical protein Ancab_000999 [Ancistrocladus abbreviatus]